MKTQKSTITTVFLTILIAGFQLDIQGLQNIALFAVWLLIAATAINSITILNKAPDTLPEPPERSLSYLSIAITTLISAYLIFYENQPTGLALMLALFMANYTKGLQNLMEEQK